MDEAPKLFEVDEALPIEQLNAYLTAYAKTSPNFMLWYDFRQPIDLKVHQIISTFITDPNHTGGKVENNAEDFFSQYTKYRRLNMILFLLL